MARNLYHEVSERILRELETGAPPWIKPWRSIGRGNNIPMNAVSRRPYSGANVVMLWMSGHASNKRITFHQALEAGGNVKKGSRGTRIYYVSSYTRKDKDDNETTARFLKEYVVTSGNAKTCPKNSSRSASLHRSTPMNLKTAVGVGWSADCLARPAVVGQLGARRGGERN